MQVSAKMVFIVLLWIAFFLPHPSLLSPLSSSCYFTSHHRGMEPSQGPPSLLPARTLRANLVSVWSRRIEFSKWVGLCSAHFNIRLICGSVFMPLLSTVSPVSLSRICNWWCLSRFLASLLSTLSASWNETGCEQINSRPVASFSQNMGMILI